MVSTKDLLNYAYCVIELLFLGQLAYADDSSSALATGGIDEWPTGLAILTRTFVA